MILTKIIKSKKMKKSIPEQQEQFKKELLSTEYASFNDKQKMQIMIMIKNTNWELAYIRYIFKNPKIQNNIDKYITMFEILKNCKEDSLGHYVCRYLLSDVFTHINEDVDLAFCIKVMQLASSSSLMGKNDYYQCIIRFAQPLLLEKNQEKKEKVLELIQYVLNSPDKGIKIGLLLYHMIDSCHFDIMNYSLLIKRAFDGIIEDYPEMEVILNDCREIFKNLYYNYADIPLNESKVLYNLINLLQEQIATLEVEEESPQLPLNKM